MRLVRFEHDEKVMVGIDQGAEIRPLASASIARPGKRARGGDPADRHAAQCGCLTARL
jgi:Rv2993c-like, N-terminal